MKYHRYSIQVKFDYQYGLVDYRSYIFAHFIF